MTALQIVAEGEISSPLTAEAWGILVLGILIALLIGTLIFGKGRPHA